jgi:hypothetical protein
LSLSTLLRHAVFISRYRSDRGCAYQTTTRSADGRTSIA